jgi:molybdate transport system substrate-binding protein
MTKKQLVAISLVLAVCILSYFGAMAANSKRTELIVSAAASLTDSLLDIEKLYEKSHPTINLTFNFGSSGTLQKQIEQGAPADVFVSAGVKQMGALVDKGYVQHDSHIELLSNDLVVVLPIDRKHTRSNATAQQLTDDAFKVIAMGIPDIVPAGQYAKEALEWLGLYDSLMPKLVHGKDVRQVLTYVETGNADAGFVYRTDALTSKKVIIALTIEPDAHQAIVYPVGVMKETKHKAEAEKFYKYLQGQEATEIFLAYGFKSPLHVSNE